MRLLFIITIILFSSFCGIVDSNDNEIGRPEVLEATRQVHRIRESSTSSSTVEAIYEVVNVEIVRIYFDQPLFTTISNIKVPFSATNESFSKSARSIESRLTISSPSSDIQLCEEQELTCFLVPPLKVNNDTTDVLDLVLKTMSARSNELMILINQGDLKQEQPRIYNLSPSPYLTTFSGSSVQFNSVIPKNTNPLIVYHEFHDPSIDNQDEDSTTNLLSTSSGLLSRAATAMGMGPDTFVEPIAGGALKNIIDDLLQRFLGYFGACIMARFSGFLLGWENDVNRPQVIIWDAMDMMKEIDKHMAILKEKMEVIKAHGELQLALAEAEVLAAKAEIENTKIQAEAARELALAMIAAAIAEAKSMADMALAQVKAMMAQAMALAQALLAQAMALAAAALSAARAAAAAAAAAMAQLQAMIAAQMASAMSLAASTMDLAKKDTTGQIEALAKASKLKADAAVESSKLASQASKVQAEALAAQARTQAAAAAAKAKVLSVLAIEKKKDITLSDIKRLQNELLNDDEKNATNVTTTDDATNVTTTDATNVATTTATTATTAAPCDEKYEQCDYPTSAHQTSTYESEKMSSDPEIAKIRIGITDQMNELDNARDDITALLLEWSADGDDNIDDDDGMRFRETSTVTAMRTQIKSSAVKALSKSLEAIRIVRELSVKAPSTKSSLPSLKSVDMNPKSIRKWANSVIQYVDDHPVPDLVSLKNKREMKTETSVLLETLANKRKDLKGIPKASDGAIVQTLIKTITKSLTKDLSISLTESISALLHERMAKLVLSDLEDTLPGDISAQLDTALTGSLGESVSYAVSSIVDRSLPAYLTNSIRDTLTSTLTRALTHTLTPTLIHTLRGDPVKTRAAYQCQICLHRNRLTFDSDLQQIQQAGCVSVCPYSTLEWLRVENHALYYAYHYSAYYSDYYADYYRGGVGDSHAKGAGSKV